MGYKQEYQRWRANPEEFWMRQAAEIDWHRPPSGAAHTDRDGRTHWFADGELNSCYLALDYHVNQGRGEQAALVYDSPVTKQQISFTYSQLLSHTAKVADMFKECGVVEGDTVIIYMPMIPQAVIAMLACARIGAVHSVVFGGFAAKELASRIDDAKPKLIVSASCGIEINRVIEYKPMLDAALDLATHQPEHCIIYQREQARAALTIPRDIDWQAMFANARPADVVWVNGNAPLYILYTSGTTGKPKGVVRDNAGHAVALNYSMRTIYAMQAGDVFWSASDVGWVVGHSYIVYGPLIRGCTSILYEGKPILTPDAGAFWRVVNAHKVNALFSAPTAFRAIRREDPNGDFIKQYDLSSLRTIYAAGERLDPSTQDWLTRKVGVDVIDNWWQTETGWPICANPVGIEPLAIKHGSASKPVPGFDVHVLDDNGHKLGVGKQGNIALKLPLPPGCLNTLWNDWPRYRAAYLSEFPGYYASGDGGYFDHDGYLYVMGRVDDVINVAGHRLSTGDLEQVLSKHPSVAECAVVAMRDELKGELPVGFIVLSNSPDAALHAKALPAELASLVRTDIGAIACYKSSYIVPRLPKTRSGKILRKVLTSMLNGEAYITPATIEDGEVLNEIADILG